MFLIENAVKCRFCEDLHKMICITISQPHAPSLTVLLTMVYKNEKKKISPPSHHTF